MRTKLRVARSRCGLPLMILFFLCVPGGCQGDSRLIPSAHAPSVPGTDAMVVMGFQPATARQQGPELVRNPITGTSLMSWPVPETVVEWLTNQLFDMLVQKKDMRLIPPGQARGVRETITGSDAGSSMHPVDIIKHIGKAFQADAVLVGQVYRWQERVGTEYGIDKPASVAFDLSLVRPADGAVMWRGNYDKTQRSLFENLFDFNTYIKSGGRWLTAQELALLGLEHLIAQMPGGSPPAHKQGKD